MQDRVIIVFTVTEYGELVWMLSSSMLQLNCRKLSLRSFGVVTKKNDNHNYLKRRNKHSPLLHLYIQLFHLYIHIPSYGFSSSHVWM